MTRLDEIKARMENAEDVKHLEDTVKILATEVRTLHRLLGDIVAGEPGAVKRATIYLKGTDRCDND